MDHMQLLAQDCKIRENASASDMASLLAGDYPTTESGKCLHACMQELLGIVSGLQFFICRNYTIKVKSVFGLINSAPKTVFGLICCLYR